MARDESNEKPVILWFVRHGLAAVAGLLWPPVAAAVAYGVLLLAAVIFGKGVGGPLALPAMVIFAGCYGVWAVFGVAWPAVAGAEWLIRADGLRPALARLGAALLFGLVLAMAWSPAIIHLAGVPGIHGQGQVAATMALAALPMVLLHWFVVRSLRTVVTAGRGLGTVLARRWPGPGSGSDAGEPTNR
jgi:hypothetical protein